MAEKKILYVCQQIVPFIQESTPLSDTCKVLPVSIAEQGNQVRIFTPRYGLVNERRNQLHEVIRLSGMNLIIADNDHQLIIKVASVPNSRQQVYFVDNEDFFRRKAVIRDETGIFFEDNDQRALFFARGVLETVKKLRWSPECIHLHGWISYFIPAYLKYYYKDDPIFANTKIILSIYESDRFSEKLDEKIVEKLNLEKIVKNGEGEILKEPTYENLVKFVLQFCSGAILVGNISKNIKDCIEKLNIPFEEMSENDINCDTYTNFYEKILED